MPLNYLTSVRNGAIEMQRNDNNCKCHNNVYGPKQILSPEGRDCLLLDAIDALPRLPLPECDDSIKVLLRFLV